MDEKLLAIEQELKQDISKVNSLESLENIRIKYLGRKEGVLTQLFKLMSELSAEQKPLYGKKINDLKILISDSIAQKSKELESVKIQTKSNQAKTAFDINFSLSRYLKSQK